MMSCNCPHTIRLKCGRAGLVIQRRLTSSTTTSPTSSRILPIVQTLSLSVRPVSITHDYQVSFACNFNNSNQKYNNSSHQKYNDSNQKNKSHLKYDNSSNLKYNNSSHQKNNSSNQKYNNSDQNYNNNQSNILTLQQQSIKSINTALAITIIKKNLI